MLNYRKDKSPEDTINDIKQILKFNGIKIKEFKTKSISKHFFSTRVEIKGFYNMGTNGKGITPTLARASAYSELMERIQSRILLSNYFLNKNGNIFTFSSECYNDIEFDNNTLLDTFFAKKSDYNKMFTKNSRYKILDTYTNLINNEKVNLPTRLIYLTTSSNGLCAGNNYYEAINQGICEIFERYIYKKILFGSITLNDIKIDCNLPIYDKIKEIEKRGYTIIVKDCTNGLLPVIGVLIIKKDKYLFTLGADCDINIAIQRCLTEAFQGLGNYDEIDKKMKSIDNDYETLTIDDKYVNWLQCYASNNGIHPQTLFLKSSTKNYEELSVFKDISTNKDVFKYLITIIKNMNLDIYVKNDIEN